VEIASGGWAWKKGQFNNVELFADFNGVGLKNGKLIVSRACA
jgi:hypothetical protein